MVKTLPCCLIVEQVLLYGLDSEGVSIAVHVNGECVWFSVGHQTNYCTFIFLLKERCPSNQNHIILELSSVTWFFAELSIFVVMCWGLARKHYVSYLTSKSLKGLQSLIQYLMVVVASLRTNVEDKHFHTSMCMLLMVCFLEVLELCQKFGTEKISRCMVQISCPISGFRLLCAQLMGRLCL